MPTPLIHIALLMHIYNQDSWEKIFKDQLKRLYDFSPIILVNLCLTNSGNDRLIASIRKDFPEAFIIVTPNKGRDIGGKLALIDFFLKGKLKCEFMALLHDKQSPHRFGGDAWRQKLFAIIEVEKINLILEQFRLDRSTGVIATSDFIKNEYDKKTNEFKTTNNTKLKELIQKHNLRVSDYRFVAGAMFWIRTAIIKEFFSRHSPLSCRELLEEGNFTDQYDGTYTHSWERIFCWLANDQGYRIKGI